MFNYVEKIADLIAPQVDGLEREEILDMIETPADSKMGDYAFPLLQAGQDIQEGASYHCQRHRGGYPG